MKTTRWLVLGVLIAVCFLAAPQTASADTVSTVEKIFDMVHLADSSVPSGSDLDALIRCLDNPTQNIGTCATVAGADGPYADTVAALFQAVTSDSFGAMVSIVVQWLGDDAPCIIADILTGGAGGYLCDLIKEVLGVLADIGGVILEFFADIGGAVADAVEEIGCALGLGGCGDSSPADQVVFAWVYAPTADAGVTAIEDVGTPGYFGSKKYDDLLTQLRSQASANPAQLNIQLPIGISMTFPGWAVDNAEKVYKGVVATRWNADLVKTPDGILWKLETARGNYSNDLQMLKQTADEAVGQDLPGDWIAKHCASDFQQTQFAQVDRWVGDVFNKYEAYVPSADRQAIQTIRGKTQSNLSWCRADYVGKRGPKEFADHFRGYIKANLCQGVDQKLVCPSKKNFDRCARVLYSVSYPSQLAHECVMKAPDCPQEDGKYVCSQQGYDYCRDWAASVGGQVTQCVLEPPSCKAYANKYFCSTTDDYSYCTKWAASVGVQAKDRCSIDTTQLGSKAAHEIKSYLDTLSPHKCTIAGASNASYSLSTETGTVQHVTANPALVSGAKDKTTPVISQTANPALSQGGKPPSAAARMNGPSGPVSMANLGTPPKTTPMELDCPRLGLQHACKVKYGELYGPMNLPLPLVDCGFKPDPAYATQMSEVEKAVNTLNSKFSNQLGAYPLAPSEVDPLVVPVKEPLFFDKLKDPKDPSLNMNFFTVPPSSKHTFDFVKSMQPPIDGVATPTMFFDAAAWQNKLLNVPLPTQSIEDKVKKEIEKVKHGGRPGDPIDQVSRDKTITTSPQAVQGVGIATKPGTITNQTGGMTTPAMQVMQGRAPAALNTFKLSATSWKSLTAAQAAPPGCSCSALLIQINGLEQRSAALIKEGETLTKSLDTRGLSQADADKATQRLGEITKQLDANMTQRTALLNQYNMQLKNAAPQQQKTVAPVIRK